MTYSFNFLVRRIGILQCLDQILSGAQEGNFELLGHLGMRILQKSLPLMGRI